MNRTILLRCCTCILSLTGWTGAAWSDGFVGQRFMTRLRMICIIAVVLLFGGTTKAAAHAVVQRAEPTAESTVQTSPTQVRLWFSERLEPGLSSVRVVNERGEQVDTGDAKVEPAEPNQLHVSLSSLSPGTYKVLWRVMSVDGHATRGSFTFRVAP